MEKSGVIYILTNPSFPEYVKIGYADDVNKRLAQLNSSECVPFSFRIYATYEVSDRLTDKKVHSIIDRLNPGLRAIENNNGKKHVREFYAMSAEDAYKILEDIASINGLQDRLKRIAPSIDEEKHRVYRESRQTRFLILCPRDAWVPCCGRCPDGGPGVRRARPRLPGHSVR